MSRSLSFIAWLLCCSPNLWCQETQYEKIENNKDGLGACRQDNLDTKGCCGSPGMRVCTNLTCVIPPAGSDARSDKYSGLIVCNPKGASCSQLFADKQRLLANPNGPLDVTFYVTSDVHFFRPGWKLADQARHVRLMNEFYSLGQSWPTGLGIPAGRIPAPLGVAIAGDLTLKSQPGPMGGYRMLYEENMIADSIQYPVFVGLGNHDTISPDNQDEEQRMFDYLEQRMSCGVNFDAVSHSYSWDWNRLHIVQLNYHAGYEARRICPGGCSNMPWLIADLKSRVGNSGRPVIVIQHLGCDSMSIGQDYLGSVTKCLDPDLASNPWWSLQQRIALLAQLKPYNVVGLFSGHTHSVGVYRAAEWSDVRGNYVNRLDNYVNGTAGINDNKDNEGPGHGEFYAVHVTDSYLDVVPIRWDDPPSTSLDNHISLAQRQDQSTETSRVGPNRNIRKPAILGNPSIQFKFGQPGCRKRIGDRIITVPPHLYSLTQTGPTAVLIRNTSGAPMPGPLALRVSGRSTAVSFVDSCVDEGDALNKSYVTNAALDIPLNQSIPANGFLAVDVGQPVSLNSTELVVLTPVQGASQSDIGITIAPGASVPPGSVTFYGMPNTALTAQVTGDGGLGWLQVTPANGAFDAFGRARVNYSVDTAKLPSQSSGSLTVTILGSTTALDWNNLPYSRGASFTLTFKAPIKTIELTANPPSLAAPNAPKVTFRAHLTYDRIPSNDSPGGEVDLLEVSADGKTRTVLSRAFLNTRPDNLSCSTYPADTVVFGDDGFNSNFCPSLLPASPSGWKFSLPVGLHRLVASYIGSGNGDSSFQPAESPVLLYRVGAPAVSMRSLLPIPYITAPGVTFDNPIFVRVFDAQGVGVSGVPITVTMPVSGASAGFPQSPVWSTYTDINGVTNTPLPTANNIAGTYNAVAAVAETGSSLSVQIPMTNVALTGVNPAITAAVAARAASPFPGTGEREWTVLLKNSGGAAYGVSLTKFSLAQEAGPSCNPVIRTGLPLSVNSLPTAASGSVGQVDISFGSCPPATRFTVTVGFSANGGAYTGQTVIGHQFQ